MQRDDRTNYAMIVVDDEPGARAYALRQIEWERLGITELCEADNGLDALSIMQEKRPDIMILDIRMPGMDGVALLDEICRRNFEVAVIGLSGYSDFEAARKMLSSGKVVEYLLKPASADALFEAVTRCLEKIQLRQQMEWLRLSGTAAALPEHDGAGGDTLGADPFPTDLLSADLTPAGHLPTDSLPPEVSGRKTAIVRMVKEYIQLHYAEKLTLEQIAAQVYINPSYLSRIFAEVEGNGLNRYLQKIRIDRAKELLRDPRYKVYEAADLVGYPNFQHFLKVFKKLEHTTPSKYRENADWLMEP